METLTYQEALKKITDYMITDTLQKRDVFDYSTILSLLFDKPKEQTLLDLFEAQK